jgi:hypothetical protein
MYSRSCILVFTLAGVTCLMAQDAAPTAPQPPAPARKSEVPPPDFYKVDTGTRIPLSLINSVSTKNAAPGDRVYLQTAFPVLDHGKIVIPPGSYVAGTVTQSKRPGHVRGRGELYIRFDSLTLPNGVTRDFHATLSGLDGMASEELDKSEGKVRSSGNKGGDAKTVGETAAAGASIGAIAGSAAGHGGMGAGLGAAAGAAAGLVGVLMTRGPDAILERGSTVEMVLDRQLQFEPVEIDFSGAPPHAQVYNGPGPQSKRSDGSGPLRRWPF